MGRLNEFCVVNERAGRQFVDLERYGLQWLPFDRVASAAIQRR